MKQKVMKSTCGIAAAALAVFLLAACDDDSTSVSPVNQEMDVDTPASSGNDTPTSSEAATPTSSEAPTSSESATESSSAVAPGSSSAEEPTSSATIASSSSSAVQSSSANFEKCIDMDRMCPPCEGDLCPVTNVACNHCSEEGAVVPDCKGGSDYVCSNRLWTQIKPTCEHITDFDGMSAEGNCVGRTGDVVTDCVTGQQFKCVDNFWEAKNNVCPPGGDCDGDGIPDGIRRPDLEPCDTDTLLEFYGRAYQCVNNKWVYLPPPTTYINEKATDVSAMHRGGPAVAPGVVKVEAASGAVTFRDDGVLVDDRCTFNGLNAELRGDTLVATILYPGCTTTGGSMGVITFTLSGEFADVKYIKYDDRDNVKPVREADELLPCGNTSSCNSCSGDRDPGVTGC